MAEALTKAGHGDEALDVLAQLAEADPTNIEIKAHLALAYVARGDLSKAKSFLSPETAGANPALWMTIAEIELRGNRLAEGKTAVMQAMKLDSNQTQAAVVLGCKLAEVNADAGYQPIEAVADAALAADDFAAAAVALHEFTTRVPSHLVALMRLVEICVDGGLESTMYEAQAQLAEAYLASSRALEARIISEDLVAREPWNKANIDRFRRALVMLGEGDPDAIIADRLSGDSPFLATEKMDLNEEAPKAGSTPPAAEPRLRTARREAQAADERSRSRSHRCADLGATPPSRCRSCRHRRARSTRCSAASATTRLGSPPKRPPRKRTGWPSRITRWT